MLRVRYLLPAMAFAAFACGDDSDPAGPAGGNPGAGESESPPVASITVEGPVVMLWDAGLSTRLSVSALDSEGQPIPGVPFEWTTADVSVATVADGVVTATDDGWTQITASASGITDAAQIVVVTPDGPKDRTDCNACHGDEYVDQHGDSNTPITCLQCHSGPTWTSGDFDHPTVANGFDLLGAHALISCGSCHEPDGSPKYPGVADDECVSCHQADYDGQHEGSGTPTTCLQCHTRDSWTGADFDHPTVANGFDLLGAHALISCASCHDPDGSPKYPGVADDECVSCHQADYDGQHEGSGYPTTCLTCHTRDSWSGADFNHDLQFFPILSGKHQGKWGGCETCHIDPSDYTKFSCFACHPHDQDRMDDKHSEISAYVYDSDRCYACHPDGQAD